MKDTSWREGTHHRTMKRMGQATSPSFASAACEHPATTIPHSKPRPESAAIPRSASYDHISDSTLSNDSSHPRINRTLSDNTLASRGSLLGDVSRLSFVKKQQTVKDKSLRRHPTTRSNTKSPVTVSNSTLARLYDEGEGAASKPEGHDTANPPELEHKPRSVSRSLSSFAKKSWSTASRSPSPMKRPTSVECESSIAPVLDHARPFLTSAAISEQGTGKSSNATTVDSTKKGSIEGKKLRRPLSVFLGRAPFEYKVLSVPLILPKSLSSDRLPSMSHVHSSPEIPSTITRSISSDRLYSLTKEPRRRRDELWSAFQTLDGEFQK